MMDKTRISVIRSSKTLLTPFEYYFQKLRASVLSYTEQNYKRNTCFCYFFYVKKGLFLSNIVHNNNNNLLHLYSAFLGTQSTLHSKGGYLLIHHQCAASTWMMRWQPYCARTPTTHQLIGGEETVIKPISV